MAAKRHGRKQLRGRAMSSQALRETMPADTVTVEDAPAEGSAELPADCRAAC